MDNLVNDINSLSGNVLGIGIEDDKLIKSLNKNKDINTFMIMRNPASSFFNRKKARMDNGKKVNMKKMKKIFNKKSVDYVICDFSSIKDFFKYFISNSIYINSKKLYLYGSVNDIDEDVVIKRYKRYNVTVEKIINEDEFLLIIDNTCSKNHFFRDKWYIIIDTFHNIGDLISSILIS